MGVEPTFCLSGWAGDSPLAGQRGGRLPGGGLGWEPPPGGEGWGPCVAVVAVVELVAAAHGWKRGCGGDLWGRAWRSTSCVCVSEGGGTCSMPTHCTTGTFVCVSEGGVPCIPCAPTVYPVLLSSVHLFVAVGGLRSCVVMPSVRISVNTYTCAFLCRGAFSFFLCSYAFFAFLCRTWFARPTLPWHRRGGRIPAVGRRRNGGCQPPRAQSNQ